MSNQFEEAKANATLGLVQEMVPETPPTEAPQETAAAVVEQSTEEPVPEEEIDIDDLLAPDLPEGYEVDDEAPELDDEEETDEDDEEYVDPDEERAKRKALEKKLAQLEAQKLNEDRKRWADKEGEYFPLVDARELAEKCKSRREFRRRAKEENDRLLPIVKKALDAQRQAETKKQADAWGTPTAGTGYVPSETEGANSDIAKARRTGSLTETIKARIAGGFKI